jgi:predicted nucleic acid-binding Zn ribbon protein
VKKINGLETKECPVCGKQFHPGRADAVMCSPRCRLRKFRKRQKSRPMPTGLSSHLLELIRKAREGVHENVEQGFLEVKAATVALRRNKQIMKPLLSRLDPDTVRLIRKSSASGRALAKEYGVSPSTISRVRSGKIWREVDDGTTEKKNQ